VVAFSKNDIFAIRKEIEAHTPYKCCVVYGNLPPETRAAQAKLFNDPDSGYDILVASDAIGMGLNLNIRRVIFHTIYKSNGDDIIRLDHSSFKQIGGRAGRRSSEWKFGEVTCRRAEDMRWLKEFLGKEIPMIRQAGLLPTVEHIENFADALAKGASGDEKPGMKEVVGKFSALAKVEGNYFLCRQEDMNEVADGLEDLELPISDKFIFCVAPANSTDKKAMRLVRQFAERRAENKGFSLNMKVSPNIVVLFCTITVNPPPVASYPS